MVQLQSGAMQSGLPQVLRPIMVLLQSGMRKHQAGRFRRRLEPRHHVRVLCAIIDDDHDGKGM
jgi:hypothetical protein